jgi:signal transduction histidine kinase
MKFSELKKQVDSNPNSRFSREGEQPDRDINLEVILDIVKSINSSLILEDVLELVLKNAIKLTNSERGFIVLKDIDGNLEYKLGMNSVGTNLPEEMFNISHTVVEDVFNTGQSRFIEGAQNESGLDQSKSILRLELQTILCSPLIAEGKKIGVIYVDSKHLQKIKAKQTTSTFEILAGQAATAIRNAQLYHGQINAYNALNEANVQLIQAERKTLKSSIDSEIGQSLQVLVHLALLETESLMRTIEKTQKEYDSRIKNNDLILFDRLKLKSKVATDSIRNIQKYAQVLLETSIMNLNKDSGDLNKTILSVIKYLSPMKKFLKSVFKTELNPLPLCNYDSEQIQHLLVHLFSNSAEARADATICVRSFISGNDIVIQVEDNGPGVDPSKVVTYFESPSPHKSGYGLYLCKSIVDRHNGEIKALENQGGALFQFSLPYM